MSLVERKPCDAERPAATSMRRGLFGRCPRCGEGRIYRAYLKVAEHCTVCGEPLHHHRADDAPPYLTILIVGHIVVGLMLLVETLKDDAPLWIHMAVWPTLAVLLSLWLLPLIKGALIGYQWALKMHGFGKETDDAGA
jgi:uncharacterized protein (DUF983 family)